MTPKTVTLLIFLLASSRAWDFDLLVETIYDHFEIYEDDDSAESGNSTKPASSTSSVSPSSATPLSSTLSTAISSTPSTTATPPSSPPPTTSATSPVVLAAPASTAAPSIRKKRELLPIQDDNQFKPLYENVPYPSRYAPNYQEPLNEENHREARKLQHAKSADSTKSELIKLLLRLVEDSENEEPKHNRPNVIQRVLIKMPQVQHEVIDDSNKKDKEKCKSDDKNYITCVTDRKVVETIRINPVDHSEVRKIHENIKVSIMKNDKLPPEEAIDKVFKHEPDHPGPMSYEEDVYYPYPYHHKNDYKVDKNRRRHRPDYLSSRFNAEDEKKDEENATPSTSTT